MKRSRLSQVMKRVGVIVSVVVLGVLCGSTCAALIGTRRHEALTQGSTDGYKLNKEFKGEAFFNEFEFFTSDDPTEGYVDYIGKSEAQRLNLIDTTGQRAIIRADSTNVATGRGRKAVRLQSYQRWDDGLWVFDINHMPEGCGTWPAYWTNGPLPWPTGGEIDIIEGANLQTQVHSALHTTDQCTMKGTGASEFMTGSWSDNGLNCYHLAHPYNIGCAVDAHEPSYGKPLNEMGGGVFVMELDRDKHIRTWFFRHEEVPADIKNGAPSPSSWTKKPYGYFPFGSNCDGRSHFTAQHIIINLTFCGGWAGHTYGAPCPGGKGMAACIDHVKNRPEAFAQSYWDINSLRVYQRPPPTEIPTLTTATPLQDGSVAGACLNHDVDYVGHDLHDGAIYGVSSLEMCISRCQGREGCAHYTFIAAWEACFLKSEGAAANRVEFIGAVSGSLPGMCTGLGSITASTSSTTPAPTPLKCREDNIDYYGHDLSDGAVYEIHSLGACASQCAGTQGCVHFTYVPAWAACYRKGASAPAGRRVMDGAISGSHVAICTEAETPASPVTSTTEAPAATPPRRLDGAGLCLELFTDYYGNNIPDGARADVVTWEACRKSCREESACSFFTYVPSTKMCYLKSAATGRRLKTTTFSGPEVCLV